MGFHWRSLLRASEHLALRTFVTSGAMIVLRKPQTA